MKFEQALKEMKRGIPMKLPSWGGYWCWDEDVQSIIMYTKDNQRLDIRETQRVEYTLMNVLSDEWISADGNNTTILGGTPTFNFGEALKYLKRGMKVTKQSWHKSGMYLELQVPDAHSKMTAPYIYITIDGTYRIPWHPSQADAVVEDWMFAD